MKVEKRKRKKIKSNMYKIKVLILDGCSLCKSLVAELRELGIHFVELNADLNNDLANRTEALLGTINYPITIVELPQATTYLYRADVSSQLTPTALDNRTIKAGCASINGMVQQIKTLLNK